MATPIVDTESVSDADSVSILDHLATTPTQGGQQDELEFGEGDNALNSPSIIGKPPLLQPAASRMISCLRAPCLKRGSSSSGIGSPHGSSSPTGSGTISPAYPPAATEMASLSTICSFASIKSISAAPPRRQVHFDEEPPEAGITYSRDNYDRRPIECTRGGSLSDLSLPPRGMCPSYSGDADDEACIEEEDDEETNQSERLRGFARWARLKNGGTILGGATLKMSSANSSYTSAANSTVAPTDDSSASVEETIVKNTCSLPVHGIRSFGGLAGSIGHSDEVHTVEEGDSISIRRRRRLQLLAEQEGMTTDRIQSMTGYAELDDDEADPEQIAFRQAVYAALSMSPNATPMPSPSVRTRWECATSYFVQACAEAAAATDASEETLSAPLYLASSVMEDVTNQDEQVSTPQQDEKNIGAPQATVTLAVPNCCASPPRGDAAHAKISPSPSVESSTNPSSSPMSSRCSSTDTWSSNDFGGDSEADAFDSAFAKSMSAFSSSSSSSSTTTVQPFAPAPSSAAVAAMHQDRDRLMNEPSWRTEVSSPSEAADSAEYEQGMSSSSTGAGNGCVSSCGTSPDVHPSEGPQSLLSVTKYALDMPMSPLLPTARDPGRGCSMAAFLSGQRRAVTSQSAPTSALHSPCVLSADESDERSSSPKSGAGLTSTMQRSISCSRKGRKQTKRIASSGDSPADSDDGSSSPRIRRGTGQRSKSMSATFATLKKSSFSTCSFRSDIDDEGALGGF